LKNLFEKISKIISRKKMLRKWDFLIILDANAKSNATNTKKNKNVPKNIFATKKLR